MPRDKLSTVSDEPITVEEARGLPFDPASRQWESGPAAADHTVVHHALRSHERQGVFSMRARAQTDHDFKLDEWVKAVHETEAAPGELMGEIMYQSERIMRIFLHAIGRCPLSLRHMDNGTVDLEFTWKQPQGIYFIVTSALIFFLCGMGFLNICIMGFDIFKDESVKTDAVTAVVRTSETASFHRGFLLFLFSGMNILNAVVATCVVIRNRRSFANLCGFWTRSLQTCQIDVSPGIILSSAKVIAVTLLLPLWVIIGAPLKLATMIHGVIALAVVTFRLFSPEMLLPDGKGGFSAQFHVFTALGALLTVFSLIWSRSLLIIYYIKIKELLNAFGTWNGRVYGAVLRSDQPQSKEARTTYKLLFKDHGVLLDLVDSVNNLFEGVLEAYFASHITCLIFELLFFFFVMNTGHRLDRAAAEYSYVNDDGTEVTHGQFFIRRYDILSMLVIFVLDQILYFMIILSTGEVAEEIMGGLEIARRTSLIGRKTDEELFFLLSIFSSLNRFMPVEVEGGGFFRINKELFASILVLVVMCIVIGLPFEPIFDWAQDRHIVGPFITALEGIPDCHWQVTRETWTFCDA